MASAEQLHGFDVGMSMLDSAERARLLNIATRPAEGSRLFTGQDLAPHLGLRNLVAEPRGVPLSRADELLRFARRARQSPDLMEIESPAAMHLALFVALRRQPEANRPALRAVSAWHAAAGLMFCKKALLAHGRLYQSQLEAANGLAVLAQAGHREAATSLRHWLATPCAASCNRALRDAAASLRASPPVAEAACWLPLIGFCERLDGLQRLRSAVWSNPRLEQLDADALLTLTDFSLRGPPLDRALLAPALSALRVFAANAPISMWDLRPAEIGDRWHDGYVLHAIDRAGLLADVRALLDDTPAPTTRRKQAGG